jgi:hypothetical protein
MQYIIGSIWTTVNNDLHKCEILGHRWSNTKDRWCLICGEDEKVEKLDTKTLYQTDLRTGSRIF